MMMAVFTEGQSNFVGNKILRLNMHCGIAC